jgi:hypothetical protein
MASQINNKIVLAICAQPREATIPLQRLLLAHGKIELAPNFLAMPACWM